MARALKVHSWASKELNILGLSNPVVNALDEGGDLMGTLAKKALSFLKTESVRFDIWKIEVEVQGPVQNAV